MVDAPAKNSTIPPYYCTAPYINVNQTEPRGPLLSGSWLSRFKNGFWDKKERGCIVLNSVERLASNEPVMGLVTTAMDSWRVVSEPCWPANPLCNTTSPDVAIATIHGREQCHCRKHGVYYVLNTEQALFALTINWKLRNPLDGTVTSRYHNRMITNVIDHAGTIHYKFQDDEVVVLPVHRWLKIAGVSLDATNPMSEVVDTTYLRKSASQEEKSFRYRLTGVGINLQISFSNLNAMSLDAHAVHVDDVLMMCTIRVSLYSPISPSITLHAPPF